LRNRVLLALAQCMFWVYPTIFLDNKDTFIFFMSSAV